MFGRPRLRLEGSDHPELDEAILEWLIEERINTPARLELVLDNWSTTGTQAGMRFPDRQLLEFGRTLEVLSGPYDPSVLFSGVIVALGADFPSGTAPRLRVAAVDRLQRLAETRRNRTFVEASDADVASRIAGDHGLQADLDMPGPVHKVVAQLNCSDLDLLRQCAASTDTHLRIDDGRLVIRPFQAPAGDIPTFEMGNDLQSYSVVADLQGQPTSLLTSGWSVTEKRGVSARSELEWSSLDVPSGDSAAEVKRAAIGEDMATWPSASPVEEWEAAALGHHLLQEEARHFVSGSGTLTGGHELHVGATVNLERLGPMYSGHYRLMFLRHRFSSTQGLLTEFKVQRNALGRP
jgi:phage protein D